MRSTPERYFTPLDRNTTAYKALGFIASPNARKNQWAVRFVREYWRTLENYCIFATEGTYSDVFETQLSTTKRIKDPSRKPLSVVRLRPGKEGGITDMADLVERDEQDSDHVSTLIFVVEAKDNEDWVPEDRSLLRTAIRNNIVLLKTRLSAEVWAAFEQHSIGLAASQTTPRNRSRLHVNPPHPFDESEVLALIAHDGTKLALCEWVVRHAKLLGKLGRIITTGHTGDRVSRYLRASEIKSTSVVPGRPGPEGGDVKIAKLASDNECRHIMFFVDAKTPHPHEADIQHLLRVCSYDKVAVNLRLTEAGATSWIEGVSRWLWSMPSETPGPSTARQPWKRTAGTPRDATPVRATVPVARRNVGP